MKKSDCKEALEIYKRFLTRVTKIGEFMKLAEVRDNQQPLIWPVSWVLCLVDPPLNLHPTQTFFLYILHSLIFFLFIVMGCICSPQNLMGITFTQSVKSCYLYADWRAIACGDAGFKLFFPSTDGWSWQKRHSWHQLCKLTHIVALIFLFFISSVEA